MTNLILFFATPHTFLINAWKPCQQSTSMNPKWRSGAGRDGLDFIVPLLQQAGNYLTKDGTLIVEAGSASNALEENFPTIPFTWLSTAYDETVVFIITASEIEKFTTTFSSR